MKTSLIITTYNWPQALNAVLASVHRQSQLPDEVIIADDGSGPATRELIDTLKASFPVPLIHSWHEDRGFRLSASRNRAIGLARFDYIIMIDGDLVLHPDFIADHLAVAEPGCLVTGKRVKLGPALSQRILTGNARPSLFSRGIDRGREQALRSRWLCEKSGWGAPDSIEGIHGCNLGFWRRDALAINGFNQAFEGWGPEDKEFALRMYHNGKWRKRVKFYAVAFHLHHKESCRQQLASNNLLFQHTLTQRPIRCAQGISELGS
ncbi:glycosyltransferase family 2 protein [Shewanella aegiceratis]|uniref:glycosyltransferase family 2 protein n=1 Tax=Shewanella aegiceratis TaxID=2864203 RepID=UPI001C655371|nr:glycosyltransferase family 2 protein [Shewanella aegiceratis]QYJ82328.1 glycosyltransferase family 2 protein [Shewanella aegiceratis]